VTRASATMAGVPAPKFTLSVLGRFELSGPDGPVDLPSKKLAGLLAYLACTAPQPQPREKLATLLWGSHFEAQARQNLRQALFRLRRVVGHDIIRGDEEEVSLAPGSIDCDSTRFEVLVRQGSRGSLAAAADLYKGQLLADVALTEEAWREWLHVQRQRFEGLALDSMVKLGEQELLLGNHQQALRAANQATTINSLREDAHRLAIRALSAGGRRADALKLYEDLKALLKRDLAVEPDPVTRALAAELRKSHAARPVSEVGSDPASETSTVLLPLPDRPSIAVLPFENLSGDPEQGYFADGMVEEIITALSRIHWLFVIARNSSFTYKGRTVDIKQVGRELGVSYVLEGSVRKAGNRVRITAQLLDATTAAHLWADNFDATLEAIFELQDNVASSVAGVIEPTLLAAEHRRATQRPTHDLTAYDLYLQARLARESADREGAMRALELVGRALERDPNFGSALAVATVCQCNIYVGGWTNDFEATRRQGIDLARRALRVAGNDPFILANAAWALGVFGEDIATAIALVDRSLQINPSFARGWFQSGELRMWAGQYDLAIEHVERSIRLSPRERRTGHNLAMGIGHFFARRGEKAAELLGIALQERSAWPPTLRFMASCLAHLGRLKEAQEMVKRLQAITPVVIPTAEHWRIREDREYFLQGLRLAVGQTA
jgi:TolB-like protein/DNA-binding SARP family transcriptional activator